MMLGPCERGADSLELLLCFHKASEGISVFALSRMHQLTSTALTGYPLFCPFCLRP